MDRWDPNVIDPDGPQWPQAVSLKRERAFAMLEGEGLTRDEIEQAYDGYQREQGVAFHDRKLREEVTGGHLLGWRQGETLLAYASVCQSELLGDKSRPIYNVLDVCLHPSLTPPQCDAILSSLLERAQAARASSVQVYCTPALYASVASSGGASVKQWFQWHLPEQTEEQA